MIFNIWIHVTFSTGFILQTEVSGLGATPNLFLVYCGPLFINLIFKTEEDKVLIENVNVELKFFVTLTLMRI